MKKSGCGRLTAVMLIVIMALSCSACGKKGGEPDESQSGGSGQESETERGSDWTDEYVYVPEFTELKNAEEVDFRNGLLGGDSLYYVSLQYHEGDERASQFICEYSLSEQQVLKEIFVSDHGMNIDDFCVAEDGSIYTVLLEESERSDLVSMLIAFDSQGNRKWEKELSEYGARSTGVKVTVDGEGRVYIFAPGGDAVWFDEQGNELGYMPLDKTVMASGVGRDGKVYISCSDVTGADELAELDIEQKTLTQVYTGFPNSLTGRLTAGTEHDFLVADWQGHLYGYDLESETAEEILSWIDYDISYSTIGGYWTGEDGSVTALLRSLHPGSADLVRLERKDPAQVPRKTEVVIAVLGEADYALETAVSAFNRQSEDCYVTCREYGGESLGMSEAVTKLNIDLVSRDNSPDMLVLNASINVEALAANGVFADLNAYLAQSDVLDEEDYPENLLACFTFQETLTGIPLTFTLNTIAGRAADLSGEAGWTAEEMIAYGEEHPEAKLFYNNDRYTMYDVFMTFGQRQFINWQEGSCSFDSEEFKSLLSHIATYPEPDINNLPSYSAKQFQDGEVLLDRVGIDEYQDIQLYDALFGGTATFIGFPTPDGSNGCRLNTFNAYGIMERSGKKDEAWRFIEFFLSEDPEVWNAGGLAGNTGTRLDKGGETQYVRDSFGRLLLGAEGKPMERYSTVVYNGMEYEYHDVTREEIERLESLIGEAQACFAVDVEVSQVLDEERQAFFAGQKSVDDMAEVIQNRVELYLREQ
ncbi:MAG: extracellular solute-binding protein [Candidatus Gastranaerophilales bacterium]|nr:extracellular solute-binding protein [Candidatus Gastranaerophilales bacterium]